MTLTLLAAALLWVALTLPLAAGVETLYFRDVFHLHFPYKAFGAAELEAARIPALNDTWALGQPFRGNPNTLSFYPGNLLYVVLPVWSAFNLHYALYWLGAGVAMMLLARTLLLGRPAAALAGLAYAGSGWMLSTLTFYNIVAVAAWWPVVMAGVVPRDRRGLVLAGLACGMALLAGEPGARATERWWHLATIVSLRQRHTRNRPPCSRHAHRLVEGEVGRVFVNQLSCFVLVI